MMAKNSTQTTLVALWMILLCKGTNFSLCCGLFIPGVKICTKNVSQVNQAEQHHSGVILKNYSYYVTFSIPDHCLARISMLTIMVHCLARISMLTSMVHEDGALEQHDSECKNFAIFHHQKNCFPTNIFNFDLDFELLPRGSYLIDWRYAKKVVFLDLFWIHLEQGVLDLKIWLLGADWLPWHQKIK